MSPVLASLRVPLHAAAPEPERRVWETAAVGLAVLLLLAGVVVAGVYYLKYRARQARIAAVMALARRIGFTFSIDDVDHITAMPFVLFAKGDGRKVDLVCSGVHNGRPLRLFDFVYWEQSSDGKGRRSRSYYRFTCAILQIPAACPGLCITHEDFLTRLGGAIGFRDVELEYDDFNRRFRVKCNDQKFAFTLLDGEMMQWLLDADGFEALEVVGPWVLLARGRLPPSAWTNLGRWLDEFHGHVPPLVYSAYPPR
jgi:hypothetical protein